MNRNQYSIILLIIISFQTGCKHQQKTVIFSYPKLAPTAISKFDTKPVFRPDFGIHLFEENTTLYFVYVDTADNLVIENTETQKKSLTSVHSVLSGIGYFSTALEGNRVFLYSRNDNTLSCYSLSPDTAILEKQYNFSTTPDLNNYHIIVSNEFPFVPDSNVIYIPYEHSKAKGITYLDSCAYLQFELKDSNHIKRGNPIFKTPAIYKSNEIYYTNQCLIKKSSNSFVYYLCSTDSIFIVDTKTGQTITAGILPHFNGYRLFDESKKDDLAYIRQHLKTGERNYTGGITRKKNIWILKRNQKDNYFDTTRFSVIVLDSNLQTKKIYNLRPGITGFLPYSKGFIHYSEKDKRIEKYEID